MANSPLALRINAGRSHLKLSDGIACPEMGECNQLTEDMPAMKMCLISTKALTAISLVAGLTLSSDAIADRIVYIHTDITGTPIAETDEQGRVIWRARHEPYGADVGGNGRSGPGFTGHVLDEETALIYMQQRYYDPYTARFVSVDPIAVDAGSASNFCRYCYGANNPYRYYDPDGRAIQALWGAPVGAGVDIVAQKLAAPGQPIDWKSVGISAGVGAVTGGVASFARAAAVRGTVTVGQSVAISATTNAAVGAGGSAANSVANGQSPNANNMMAAALANGGLSLAVGLGGAKGVLADKMSAANPLSPQGIGNHISATTSSAGSGATTAMYQGGASAMGTVVEAAQATAVSAGQKKLEASLER